MRYILNNKLMKLFNQKEISNKIFKKFHPRFHQIKCLLLFVLNKKLFNMLHIAHHKITERKIIFAPNKFLTIFNHI